jgi:hypothetical protein
MAEGYAIEVLDDESGLVFSDWAGLDSGIFTRRLSLHKSGVLNTTQVRTRSVLLLVYYHSQRRLLDRSIFVVRIRAIFYF